jgi:2-keto-3-deoxy-L-rhamnonate aldolase RhmA
LDFAFAAARAASLRRRVVQGEAVYGVFTRLADPLALEALAATDLDFAVIDVENGGLTWPQVNQLAAAALARDFPVVLRVAAVSMLEVQHAIAAGAAGLIASHVTGAGQAREIGRFARKAGVVRAYAGMARGTRFRKLAWADYRRAVLDEFLVLIQVDDPRGVQDIEGILSAQGVDGVFVGTLTLELLHDTAQGGERIEAAIRHVLAACSRAGKRAGLHVPGAADCPRTVAAGANMIVLGNELNMLRTAADELVGRARGPLQS